MRASYIWAIVILVAIGAWLSSGDFIVSGSGGGAASEASTRSAAEPATIAEAEAAEDTPFVVKVARSTARERRQSLTLRGHTEAKQRVQVRAQTAGLVEELPVEKGDLVEEGEVICRLEDGNRQAQVLRAQAALEQAEQEFDASSRLNQQGYAAETRLRAAKAGLDAAKATLSEMELDLARTDIRAPFDGVVEDLPAKRGALLSVGEPCAQVMSYDPLLAVAEVPERDVRMLERGMAANATLVTGQTVDGALTFLAPGAISSTRTFRVEFELPNPGGDLRSGVTTRVEIPLRETDAHFFSPAILTLDDRGRVGVRTVEDGDTVRFVPVEIVADEPDGVWVAGLPHEVTLIMVGQEYVEDGERVTPVFETAEVSR
ncbi:efflux RND transporter periplasmic adaptor subunit [Lutibaculum baratangense]|uniref:Efflux transporter, RND family, MFP subunit n=1 Tax=Lutibaculum baratangense AMV1 TaxID=631454 RepID=V4QXX7_9HYPH|nr:efflux RND transporter periplasmic adaptor subunit [Lutibaculum baratangense]ESR24607.1 efflux transporter, RND family, MFP subunit [Lutibaculum baratangense AMV1]